MLPPVPQSPMSKLAAEKRERQLALHEAVRSGKISARDAVRMASFFPSDQKPRLELIRKLC